MKNLPFKMDVPHNFDIDEYRKSLQLCAGYDYKGLTIHAGKGIHEAAFNYIQKNINKSASILILGAGSGSFDCRLYENGYHNITSADINFDNYQYKNSEVEFVRTDLNSLFEGSFDDQYDLVVAIEIIEHLYSTNSFLSSVKKLMSEEGELLITTPNPRSLLSRFKFFTTGYHNRFHGVPMRYEHINPIHMGIMYHHCHFNDLEFKHLESFDDQANIGIFKKLIFVGIRGFLKVTDLLLKNDLQREAGQILLFSLVHKIKET